jgi:hypothetical protein
MGSCRKLLIEKLFDLFLPQILPYQDEMCRTWAGFILMRIRAIGMLLWAMLGSSSVTVQLAASREGLNYMELRS